MKSKDQVESTQTKCSLHAAWKFHSLEQTNSIVSRIPLGAGHDVTAFEGVLHRRLLCFEEKVPAPQLPGHASLSCDMILTSPDLVVQFVASVAFRKHSLGPPTPPLLFQPESCFTRERFQNTTHAKMGKRSARVDNAARRTLALKTTGT